MSFLIGAERFLHKDGPYSSPKPKVGEGRLATWVPSLLVLLVLCPAEKDLALVVWMCSSFSDAGPAGRAEVGERQMEGVVLDLGLQV